MTITEFLEARIAEDEASAREIAAMDRRADRAPEDFARYVIDPIIGPYGGQSRLRNVAFGLHLARFGDPARVLAECEAKRRITARRTPGDRSDLIGLAMIYADHPDFDPAWGTAQV